jgi:hypothetical protein
LEVIQGTGSGLGRGGEELLTLGGVVDAVGQFDGTEVVEVLVEEVEIVLLQVLQVVLRLDSPQKSAEGVFREGLWMCVVDPYCFFEGALGIGGDFEGGIEEFF